MGPFDSPPMVPISSLLTYMVNILPCFELFSWLQKRFPLSTRLGYDDKFISRRYHFVEQQKATIGPLAHGCGEINAIRSTEVVVVISGSDAKTFSDYYTIIILYILKSLVSAFILRK